MVAFESRDRQSVALRTLLVVASYYAESRHTLLDESLSLYFCYRPLLVQMYQLMYQLGMEGPLLALPSPTSDLITDHLMGPTWKTFHWSEGRFGCCLATVLAPVCRCLVAAIFCWLLFCAIFSSLCCCYFCYHTFYSLFFWSSLPVLLSLGRAYVQTLQLITDLSLLFGSQVSCLQFLLVC